MRIVKHNVGEEYVRARVAGTLVMSNLLRQALNAEDHDELGSLGMPRRPNRRGMATKVSVVRPWSDYFEQKLTICCGPHKQFNVYYSAPSEPNAPIFIFHHGIASSGLSFAVAAKATQEKMQEQIRTNPVAKMQYVAGMISFDMRGHGETVVSTPDAENYSLDTMVDDFLTMCEAVIEQQSLQRNPIVLVGHSMGGAVVSKAAVSKQVPNIVGLCVFDAVEGPALETLGSMDLVLASWPKTFTSIEQSIDWHLESHTLRNRESAEVSVQGMLKQDTSTGNWTWTHDPQKTRPYWRDWFLGLSSTFLAAPVARLLILAGTDRLDKELIIGQMQGKYQLAVFTDSGHFIQEDEPVKTAVTLVDFWERTGRPVDIVPKFGKFRSPGA